MIFSKKSAYIFILIGCVIAFYVQADEEQNVILLSVGIAFLMFGLYNLMRTIPSKKDNDEENI